MHTKNEGENNIRFFPPQSKFRFSTIRKECLEHFRNDTYDELRIKIEQYKPKGLNIDDFFRHEGNVLLYWALISSPYCKGLEFIKQNVSHDALKQVLSQKNFSLLKSFLFGEAGGEESNNLKTGWVEHRNEKLKFLLEIDPEGITSFLQENMNAEWVTAGLKESIKNTLEMYYNLGK